MKFTSYPAQEIQSSNNLGESSDSSDDEEGWLSQSNFNNPPSSPRRRQAATSSGGSERRPLDIFGFDVRFSPLVFPHYVMCLSGSCQGPDYPSL